jgi:hypothetical protein
LFINNVVAHLNAVLLVLDSIGTAHARAAVARNEQELKPANLLNMVMPNEIQQSHVMSSQVKSSRLDFSDLT